MRTASPRVTAGPRPGGPLRPGEIANAGVFAALAVVIVSVGTFLPHLGVLELLAAVPFAIVGLRNRVRAVVASAVAAGFVALPGRRRVRDHRGRGLRGARRAVRDHPAPRPRSRHRRPGRRRARAGRRRRPSSGCWPCSRARDLAFGSIRATVAGGVRIAESVGLPASAGHAVISVTDTLLRAWPVVVAAVVVIAVLAAMLVTNALVGRGRAPGRVARAHRPARPRRAGRRRAGRAGRAGAA